MTNDYIYFDGVPQIDFLLMEQILFSFEGIPIVFVCLDKNKSRYLCVCDDIIDEESWLIVKIDDSELLKVLNDNATVLSAFADKKVILANKEFNENIKYDIVEYNNISKDDLPVSDQYLEMKDNLKTYIEKIRYEILCSQIKLHLPSNNGVESDYVSNMNILLKKDSKSDLHNVSLDMEDINRVLNHFSDSSITIKINYKESDNELSTLTEKIVSIASAA